MKSRLFVFILTLLPLIQACQQTPKIAVRKIIKRHLVIIKTITDPVPDSVCIAAVGDIMLGTSYPSNSTLPPDSARNSFKAVEHYLRTADVAFGNLEGTLLDQGDPAPYKMHFRSKAYLFRMPVSYGAILKNSGFKIVSIANNHIGDFGYKGRISTMKTLDSCGIRYAGLLSCPTVIFTVKGIKYGFCSFSPNSQAVSLLDLKGAGQIIKDLKNRCDIVIVSFHGGGEGPAFEHVLRAEESYIGERRGNVFAFAHNAIDNGADLIFGNGPHVCRGMELYKNRLVAYSLGNFCTYKSVSIQGICGIAPLLNVYVNKKGEFLSARIIAIQQSHEKGLVIDSLNKVVARIKFLTETDFPESGLSISNSGFIQPTPN